MLKKKKKEEEKKTEVVKIVSAVTKTAITSATKVDESIPEKKQRHLR